MAAASAAADARDAAASAVRAANAAAGLGAGVSPAVGVATGRLLRDVRGALRAYLSTRSVAAALRAWARTSGLERSLLESASPDAVNATRALARLLEAATALETTGGGGGNIYSGVRETAVRETAAAFEASWESAAAGGRGGGGNSTAASSAFLTGLPFVYDALATLVYEMKIDVNSEDSQSFLDEGDDVSVVSNDVDVIDVVHVAATVRSSSPSSPSSSPSVAVAPAASRMHAPGVSDALMAVSTSVVAAALSSPAALDAALGAALGSTPPAAVAVPLQPFFEPSPIADADAQTTVVISPDRRILTKGLFDSLIVTATSANRWPGNFITPQLPPLSRAYTGVDDSSLSPSAPPKALTREEHVAMSRSTFVNLLGRARLNVVYIAPVAAHGYLRPVLRSPFLDELFGPPPRATPPPPRTHS